VGGGSELPHGGLGWARATLRPVRPRGHCLQFVSESALPQVSGVADRRLAATGGVLVVAGGILPRRLYAAGGGGRGGVAQPPLGLHRLVPSSARGVAGGGGQPQTPGGAGGVAGGVAHLGPGSALPSPSACRGRRRRAGL